ncbi:MAG: C25 family cysteine peptidase, partial [bacterium]
MKHILAILMLFSSLSGITIDIPLDKIDYHIAQAHGFDRILVDQSIVLPGKPGFPETPAYVCNYLIPKNETVREIRILEHTWRMVPGQFRLYPKQQETCLETVSVFTPPDLGVYSSSTSFPVSPVIDFHCGNMRGYRILQITVCPFRYNPATQKLYILENLILEAGTEHCPVGIAPHRTTALSKEVFNDFLLNFVENKHLVKNAQYCPVIRVEDNPHDSLPTDLPSLLGPPVDLLIITDNAQASAYETYGQFKKYFGINTVVKPISWIRQYYSGVDDAERVRHFIKDAFDKWGTVFVLLGGDTPSVPTRYIWVDRTLIWSQLWLPISSDLYYSDLDGNWNFDGDERFGEVADSIDFYPEVFVGRVPTKSSVEVLFYLDKISAYLFPNNTDIQTKALFFSSNLDENWPGLPYAYEIGLCLPKHFTKSFLDETLNNLTLQSLKDSIHGGFGIVTGIGHGDVNNICIHFTPPRVYIDNFYFDSLTNSPLYSLMVVVTCYTNPFQSDCLGEHWVMNPNGGGMCYIGPTSSSEGSIHKEYMKVMFRHLFTGTISQALATAKANYISSAQINNWHRVHQFSISLLGDPTLALWNTNPRHFDSLIVQPGSLHVGYDTIIVDPGIVNSRVVDVVFYKAGECFVRESASGGVIEVGLRTESVGYLKYAVMAKGYIMYIDSICVVPVEPYVVFSSCQVIDTLGNSNGVVNPGEGVYLDLGLANTGGGLAESVYVELVCSDSLVQVNIDSAFYGDIGVGVIGYNVTPLYFDVSESMPDEYGLDFEVF